ncbi:MAG: hypothetical protein ACLRJV_08810 [Eubacteriales bacterium]
MKKVIVGISAAAAVVGGFSIAGTGITETRSVRRFLRPGGEASAQAATKGTLHPFHSG